jgi:hypothetical protein
MDRKLVDSEVEVFIDLWQIERCLWDITSSQYANKDATTAAKTSIEKAKGIWLGADHLSAQYRTKLWLASPDLIC